MISILFKFIFTFQPTEAWNLPHLRPNQQIWIDTQNFSCNDPIFIHPIRSLSKYSLASLLSLQLLLPLNQPIANAAYLNIEYRHKQFYVQLTGEKNRLVSLAAPTGNIRLSQVESVSRPPAVDQLISAVSEAADLFKQSLSVPPVSRFRPMTLTLPSIDLGFRVDFRDKEFFVNFVTPEFLQSDRTTDPSSSRLLSTTVRLDPCPPSDRASLSTPLFNWADLSRQLSDLAHRDSVIDITRVVQDFTVSMLPIATDWRVLVPALLLVILLADARQGQAQFRAALVELEGQLETERNRVAAPPIDLSDDPSASDQLTQQLTQKMMAEQKLIDKLDEKQEQLAELEELYETLLQEKAGEADKHENELSAQCKTYLELLDTQAQSLLAEQQTLRNHYLSLLQGKEVELEEIRIQLEKLVHQQKQQSTAQAEMEAQLLNAVQRNKELTEQAQTVTQQWEARLKSVEAEKEELVNSQSAQLKEVEAHLTSKFNVMLADRDSKHTEDERVWRLAVESKDALFQSRQIAMQADRDKQVSELEARWRVTAEALEHKLESQEMRWRGVVWDLEANAIASAESESQQQEAKTAESVSQHLDANIVASTSPKSQQLGTNIEAQSKVVNHTQAPKFTSVNPSNSVRSKNALNEEMVPQALLSAVEEISDEDYDEYSPSHTSSAVGADFDLDLSPEEMQALAAEVESILATEEAAMEFAEAKRWDAFSRPGVGEIKTGAYEWPAELKQAILVQSQTDVETANASSDKILVPRTRTKTGRKPRAKTPREPGGGADGVNEVIAKKPKAKSRGNRTETKESPGERLAALKALSPDELRRRKKKDLLEDVRLLDMWPEERDTLNEYGRDTLLATVEFFLQDHP